MFCGQRKTNVCHDGEQGFVHKLETSGEEKKVYLAQFFSFVSYDLNSFLGKVQDRLEGEAIYFKERGVYLMNR